MTRAPIAILTLATLALSACESETERQADATEDRIEQQAAQSATAAGDEIAALGLTERQLLDADLVTRDGDSSGDVTALLVEVEDSEPDRYVEIPLAGLTVTQGTGLSDADLQTGMTAQDVAAMPDASVGPI